MVVGTHLVKDRGPLAVDEPARIKRERKLKVSKINSRQTRLARVQSSMPSTPYPSAAAFLAADSSPPFDMLAARVSLTSFKFWCLDAELIGVWYLESLACFACLALTGKALSRTHARNPRSISIRLSWLLF